MKLSIAIDGPAGAGKSTVARAVAARLGLTYLDTGAMYRAITLAGLRRGTDIHDAEALEALTKIVELDIKSDSIGQNIIFMDGENVTEDIRLPIVNRNVSFVARCPQVRKILVDKQRQIGSRGGMVMDGRDIGTIVMPSAEYKFFLNASLTERSRRRLAELSAKGEEFELEQMMQEIAARDKIDSEREVAPLRPAEDAIYLDTTLMTIDAVVDAIVRAVRGEE
ncbi:MAG: (d)CMP kinase [Dethiobacter sp.]|jgi:cytidylate kinase|nr:(d)CMP kinase [Dethiobacter sp.]MBS3900347.1 (d)CMP kinase [Dethiobacter sp.]MBS3983196.1 (d)CMP kinase [Dethiobacter sp.]MCL4462616.1 (d)CMP kinase [Bacillota bacterium]MCL5994011.1 (d)CMP kinase [Bacillota bacterium]